MTSLGQAVRLKLEGDATLAALATGGIWDHDEIEAQDLGRDGLTLAVVTAGTPVVKPCLYLNLSSNSPIYPVKARGKQWLLDVYGYDHQRYTTIRAMQDRAYTLLHQTRVDFNEPAGWYCREIVYAGQIINEWQDPSLGNACMSLTRYRIFVIELAQGY